jgi:hypothetical protein
MSAPTPELVDALFREKIERARRMTPEDRFLEGPRLFDMASKWTKAGLRAQYPDKDETEVERLFRQRLALARDMENAV